MKEPISATISEKAIRELDKLVQLSEFETRSRTLEEIILALSQIVDIYEELLIDAKIDEGKKQKHTNPDSAVTFLNQLDVVLSRLGITEYLHGKLKLKNKNK